MMGIGSEEDSMQNVLHLVPRRPVLHDYSHYMDNWNKVREGPALCYSGL